MNRPPIIRRQQDRVLVDRASLARLTGRSVHTIRAACPVADRDQAGRPLYDARTCAVILSTKSQRTRGPQLTNHDPAA